MPKGQLRTRFRNRIAMRREALGWTQAMLAAKLGVAPNTVARWEVDAFVPPGAVIARMAQPPPPGARRAKQD